MREKRFIAPQASQPYGRAMLAALMRMAAFVALLAMPLGMAAPAAAEHSAPAAASEPGHCGEEQRAPEAPAKQSAHCAACAALPASGPAQVQSLLPKTPMMAGTVARFDGIELEIATPPPKTS